MTLVIVYAAFSGTFFHFYLRSAAALRPSCSQLTGSSLRLGRITTAIVCIASALALPNGFAHATTQALSPNEVDTRASVYWGAHVGDLYGLNSEAPWNMKNAVAFENIAGKKLSLIEFALTWATCSEDDCETVPFPTTQMEAIRGHGAIPVLGWASYAGSLDSERQSAYQLRDIIKGRHDAYIRKSTILNQVRIDIKSTRRNGPYQTMD